MPLRPAYSAAAPPSSGGLATMGEEVNMKQQDIYRYRAAQYLPATLGGPISGQVRLLSASFGTRQPGSPESPECGAAYKTPGDSAAQAKRHAHQVSLPSHDAGHRVGGAAPYGPP